MLLRMIARLVPLLAAFGLVWLVLRQLTAAARRPAGATAGGAAAPASDGLMVRDRVCNTYLPRSSALALDVGSEQYFFCSEGCRRQFLDQSAAS